MIEKQDRRATKREPPVVRLRPSSYKPTKAELDEDVSVDATPDEVARAITRKVTVQVVPKGS